MMKRSQLPPEYAPLERFWLVWNPYGHAPTVRHKTETKAVAEAERLAKANRGSEFYVLETTHFRATEHMLRLDLRGFDPADDADDEVPF